MALFGRRGPAATPGSAVGRVTTPHSATSSSGVPSTSSSGRRTRTPSTTSPRPARVARVWAGVGRQDARTGISSSVGAAGRLTAG